MTLLAADLLNWHSVTFLFFALLACGFAAAVVATSNVVRMAFYLTLSLGATSGLFFLAGAEFVGAMQLMIYVGGTLVLLIFGVMLTAQERFVNMKTGAGEWVLGLIVGGSLLLLLLRTGFSVDSWNPPTAKQGEEVAVRKIELADARTSTPVGLALSGVRVDKLDQQDAIRRRGMSGYLLPFVIISMHLLTVLIGAGYMARTKRVKTGLILETPVRTSVPNRKFSLAIKGGIVSGVVFNLLFIVVAIALLAGKVPVPQSGVVGETAKSFLATVAALPAWAIPALMLTFLANVALLAVVYNWQSWGLVGLVIIPLVQLLFLANAGVNLGVAGLFCLIMIAPALLLVTLCVMTGRPTAWSQMD
jgi:NADH-quinone oxidoreductase subunit J